MICSTCNKDFQAKAYLQKSHYKGRTYEYKRPYYKCNPCKNSWRKENVPLARSYANAARERKYQILVEAKNKPCADCHVHYPTCVMDFDHLRDKKLNIGKGYTTVGKRRLIEEIAKCDVVCANCHRIRTQNRKDYK
jgi:hypothetical protein